MTECGISQTKIILGFKTYNLLSLDHFTSLKTTSLNFSGVNCTLQQIPVHLCLFYTVLYYALTTASLASLSDNLQ